MVGSVVWFEIHVSDIARACDFYEQLAGWQFGPLAGMPVDSYRMISNPAEGALGGAIVGGFPERCGSTGTIVYISVDRIGDAVRRVVEAGGSCEVDERLINDTDGRFTIVSDPDGNLIGLWAPRVHAR